MWWVEKGEVDWIKETKKWWRPFIIGLVELFSFCSYSRPHLHTQQHTWNFISEWILASPLTLPLSYHFVSLEYFHAIWWFLLLYYTINLGSSSFFFYCVLSPFDSLFLCPSPFLLHKKNNSVRILLDIFFTCVYGRVSGAFHVRKHYIKRLKTTKNRCVFFSFLFDILLPFCLLPDANM